HLGPGAGRRRCQPGRQRVGPGLPDTRAGRRQGRQRHPRHRPAAGGHHGQHGGGGRPHPRLPARRRQGAGRRRGPAGRRRPAAGRPPAAARDPQRAGGARGRGARHPPGGRAGAALRPGPLDSDRAGGRLGRHGRHPGRLGHRVDVAPGGHDWRWPPGAALKNLSLPACVPQQAYERLGSPKREKDPMQTDIKALAQNIDNELLENSALLASLMARHEAAKTRFHATSADDTEDLLSGLAREMDSLEPKLNEVSSRIRALNGVYLAYNWNRAYIVSGGHVHNTPNRCPGLQAETVTHMLPECSALTEAEVVELAGERACTHCYPSAPLSARQQASKLFAPDEEAKAERKIERQRKADEKEAREVRVPKGPSGPGRVFGTVRSARIEADNQLWWALYLLVYNPNK